MKGYIRIELSDDVYGAMDSEAHAPEYEQAVENFRNALAKILHLGTNTLYVDTVELFD